MMKIGMQSDIGYYQAEIAGKAKSNERYPLLCDDITEGGREN